MKRLYIQITLSTLITLLVFFLGCNFAFNFLEEIPWYDSFVHFLAGAWVATLIVWLAKSEETTFSFLTKKLFQKHFILTTIIFTLLVGLIWEAFELGLVQYLLNAYNYRSGLQPSNLDILSDLLMDIAGGGATAWLLSRELKKNSKN